MWFLLPDGTLLNLQHVVTARPVVEDGCLYEFCINLDSSVEVEDAEGRFSRTRVLVYTGDEAWKVANDFEQFVHGAGVCNTRIPSRKEPGQDLD